MRILIANDDGVYSPGICALAHVAQQFGDVRVVAPDVEMSSASHSITASRPLTIKRTPLKGIDAWRVNGTPGDCVALGSYGWDKVDVVLSGINLGPNLGNGLWHSGTLAAAKQAVLFGMRGFAFSTPVGEDEPDWEMLKRWAAKALEILLPDQNLTLVNVNFPITEPKGMRWTRQSVKQYDGKVVPGKDPMGREHYWFTVIPIEETEEGTDRYAIDHGYVSMTPLCLDLTHHKALGEATTRHPL